MEELERRHIEEQLGGVRDELADMRRSLQLIGEAMCRALAEAPEIPSAEAPPPPTAA